VREARGEKVVGFKIGYTSPSVRKAGFRTMGIDHSVHGYLWDTEQRPSGAHIDHRRFGIEGELAVTLLSTESDDVAQWEVEYEPIIEVHSMGMDGPENGLRGLQLIGTNCIHAGVVRAREEEEAPAAARSRKKKRCRLADVPLDSEMVVHIAGEDIERVTLTELQVEGEYGPVATMRWLLETLKAEGNGDERLLRPGALVLCSTPGGLYPVRPGQETVVTFEGAESTCFANTADDPVGAAATTAATTAKL